VPASVALKRIPIGPAAPAVEVEPVAKTEPPPGEPAPPPREVTLVVPAAPTTEVVPAVTPQLPRLQLDLPMRAPAPTEPAAPTSEPAPAGSWRLAQAEPIEPTLEPAPVAADETPSMIARRVHVDHLPGERMICGALPRAGVVVMIEDTRGENTIVYSGSARHYGEGGFELMVSEDGKYLVTIGGRGIEIKVQSDTVFIHA